MTFPELNFAQAVGLLSFVLGMLCFYQKDDRRLKILMVIMNINHAFHFYLLGAITATVSALLSVVRTGLSLKTGSPAVAVVFIAITLGWGIWLADSWKDMFPILGSCVGTYAVFCLKGIAMRIGFLIGALCWLTNNILVGSIGTTLLEITLIAVNLNTIRKLWKHQKLTEDIHEAGT